MKHLPILMSWFVLASACAEAPPPDGSREPQPWSSVDQPVDPTPPAAPPARTTIMVGDKLEIIDDGQLYSSINVADCLTWPSPAIKARGGADSWAGYYPHNGDIGTVIGLSKHCDAPDLEVAILDIRGYVVAVGSSGLRFAAAGSGTVGRGATVTNPSGLADGLGMGASGKRGGKRDGGGTSAGGVFAVGDSVTIVDDGQQYSTINVSDCLTWPSADLKARGGENSWGSFVPVNGHVGTVLGTSKHCSGGAIVAILDVQGYIVAIGETGLARTGSTVAVASFAVGDTLKIVDVGQLFSTINRTDCVTWPSAEIKAAAGADGWGDYYPSNGEVGTVLGTSAHCDQPGVVVVIISVGKHYVAIGETGLSR